MAEIPNQDLGKQVLKDVSRSFYLTLRALPEKMRPAVSVGYLLARASDTIADCGGARDARLALLARFREAVAGEEGETFFADASAVAREEGLKDGERVLMGRLDDVFGWLRGLRAAEQCAIREVVETITEGQTWDLTRFPEGAVVAIEDEGEAERYCYLVAGCVGEFWTEIGFGSDPSFARRPKPEMRELGKSYGMGLQMVNILRDEADDAERGRRYLPGERSEWVRKARAHLEDGLVYSRAVRGRRARFATVLPSLIGLETLDLLASASHDELAKGVKVSRRVVKSCLCRGLFFR